MKLDQIILMAATYAEDEYSSSLNRKLWKNIYRWLKELKILRSERRKMQCKETKSDTDNNSKICFVCNGTGKHEVRFSCHGEETGVFKCKNCKGKGVI